jgi:hypothetical protein
MGRVRALVLMALIVVSSAPVDLFAQNAAFLGSRGDFGLGGTFGASVYSGYSIGGILDLGLTVGGEANTGDTAVRSDIGMLYAISTLSQGPRVPFSSRIYGSYTYREEQSEFLSDNRLLRSALGYRIGVSVSRHFPLGQAFALRLGMVGEYESYVETTEPGFDTTAFTGVADVDYAEYPQQRRLSRLSYGGEAGFALSVHDQTELSVVAGVMTDAGNSVRINPVIELNIGR